jgi:hypothetical protein
MLYFPVKAEAHEIPKYENNISYTKSMSAEKIPRRLPEEDLKAKIMKLISHKKSVKRWFYLKLVSLNESAAVSVILTPDLQRARMQLY